MQALFGEYVHRQADRQADKQTVREIRRHLRGWSVRGEMVKPQTQPPNAHPKTIQLTYSRPNSRSRSLRLTGGVQ